MKDSWVEKHGDGYIRVRWADLAHDGWIRRMNNGAKMLDGSKFDLTRIVVPCNPVFRRGQYEVEITALHTGKVCLYCSKPLFRKRYGRTNHLEAIQRFNARKYCGAKCYRLDLSNVRKTGWLL